MASDGVSFQITVKQKPQRPAGKAVVSSLFVKPRPDLPAPAVVQKIPKPRPPPPAPAAASDAPHESAFLRVLRQRQAGVAPLPPVPTATAFSPDVPIAGFGEKTLREQGLEPGAPLGPPRP
jgi:hypothetical protein